MITPILNFNLKNIKIPFAASFAGMPPVQLPEVSEDKFESSAQNMEHARIKLGEELLKLEDVHCPVCGTKMLNKEQFQEMLNKAKKISTPQQYYELLKDNEKYFAKQNREIVTSARKIIDENPDIDYKVFLKKMRENGSLKFRKTIENSIDYMNENLENYPLTEKDQKIIDKYICLMSAYRDSAWPNYKMSEVSEILNSTVSKLATYERERLYRHISNSMFAASIYKNMLHMNDIEKNSNSKNSYETFYKMFLPSVSGVTKIIDNYKGGREPYNTILICNSCSHNRDKRNVFFSRNSDLRKVGYRCDTYLEDIVQNLGCKKLESSPIYLFGASTLINYASIGKISFSPEILKEQVNHVNFIQKRPEFLPSELDEEIPCSACGTTMVGNSKKRDLNLQLLEAKTTHDIVRILEENEKYINPELEEFVELIKDLVKENPDISFDDIMMCIKVKSSRDTDRYLKKIVSLCRKKAAAGIGTPGQRQKVLEFADNIENWRLKNPRISFFRYKDYDKYLRETCLFEKSGPFKMKKFVKTNFRQVAAINNMAFQGPMAIERYDGNELKAYVETIFRMSGFTMDHYMPKDRGGSDDIENLTGMCKLCNSNKSNLPPEKWINYMPKAKAYTLKNLERMEEIIDEGKLPGYENYPAQSADYLYKITRGKVDYRKRFPLNNEGAD